MLTTYTSPKRRIFLRERTLGGTAIAEWAEWDTVKFRRQDESLSIRVLVKVLESFVTPDQSYQPLGRTLRVPVELVADDNTAVHPDGRLAFILYSNAQSVVQVLDVATGTSTPLPIGTTWADYVRGLPGEYMLQGNRFAQQADTEPIPFTDLIIEHVRAALAMGRFD